MKRVAFGKTNLQVSEMCLGTMMIGDRCNESEADRILSSALEHGVNFMDTAPMYCDGRTEEILGRVLAGRRQQFVIASKIHKGIDAASILNSIDESLARLQTDYLDLYLIHWPKAGMHVDEVMESLHRVVEQGKARHIGCCNYPAYLFVHSNARAEQSGWHQFTSLQIPYNLIERGAEVEVLPMAHALGIAITAYRPLAMGLLAGRYHAGKEVPADSRGEVDERISRWLATHGQGIAKLQAFAAERSLSMSDIALAWLRGSATVMCPIVGFSTLQQFQNCLSGFEADLDPQERDHVSMFFDTEVKEEAGGAYKALRRNLSLIAASQDESKEQKK